MKIKTLSGVVAEGKDIPSGKVVDLPDKVAKFLIAIGRAEEAKEVKKAVSKK